MKSLYENAERIQRLIKKHLKYSFIDVKLSTKYYNKRDNHFIEVNVGSVRHPLQNSAFYQDDIKNLLDSLGMELGSYELLSYDFKVLKDKRSNKDFQIMILKFQEIEI